jgi:hypothetical protein
MGRDHARRAGQDGATRVSAELRYAKTARRGSNNSAATAHVISISRIIRISSRLQWIGTLLLKNIYNEDLTERRREFLWQ